MTEKALTEDEMSKIRAKAKEIFLHLEKKDPSPRSWIEEGRDVQDDRRSDRCRYFDTHGFIKAEGFAGNIFLSCFLFFSLCSFSSILTIYFC